MSSTDNLVIWSPQAHRLYGERLYYVAIRLVNSDTETASRIVERLNEFQPGGVCAYFIFGEYDLLLRIWALPDIFDQIRDLLFDDSTILASPEFEAVEIEHHAFRDESGSLPNYPKTQAVSDILSVDPSLVRRIQDANGDLKKLKKLPDFSRLRTANVVRIISPNNNTQTGIKFYVLLSFSQYSILARSDFEDIRIALRKVTPVVKSNSKDSTDNVWDASLYFNQRADLAQAVIKAVASDVSAIMPFVGRILVPLQPYKPRSTTFLIGESVVYESDLISPGAVRNYRSYTAPSFVADNFPELAKAEKFVSARVSTNDYAEILRFIEQWETEISEALKNDVLLFDAERSFADVLQAIFISALSKDGTIAVEVVTPWLAKLEREMRSNFVFYLAGLYGVTGKHLGDVVKRFSPDSIENRRNSTESFSTFGAWIAAYVNAGKESEDKDQFPKSPYTAFAQFRNDMMHGTYDNDSIETWLKQYAFATITFYGFRQSISKYIASGESLLNSTTSRSES